MFKIAKKYAVKEGLKVIKSGNMANLFGKNRLRELAQQVNTDDIQVYIDLVKTWHKDYHSGSLRSDKETSREQAYNQDFFIKILGYQEKPASPFSFEPKATTDKGQLPDAVLSYTDTENEIKNIAAVVELKGAGIDLDRPQRREGNMSPVQQGFKYKTQYRNCPFVVVSNFWEFRLYRDNLLDYEAWTLDDLVDETNDYLLFKTWYILLKQDNFTAVSGVSKTEELLSDIRIEQEEIGKKFYKVYKEARLDLLRDIYKNNPAIRQDIDIGIEKSQKIIDRVVFACFAEDKGLLPDNTLQRVVKAADTSAFGGSLWSTLKGFFEAIDVGSTKLEIPNGYNGGLFKRDDFLNNLTISDEPLRSILSLGAYNFDEDLSVTILGHIFEQSISDLEEIKNKVNESQNLETLSQSRRKKDGIFYTPDYIVRYIVDNSLGKYLREHEEKFKTEFNLKGDINEKNYEKREAQAYEKYQTFLQNVKVVDPACGSGAFLVYVFDYLFAENKRVASILGGGLFSSEDYMRSILKNNIFGVDLNEESVEITKLSLWLKSAEKDKQLTSLDKNIKCGNSLVSAPDISQGNSFDWKKEFKEVFEQGGFDVVVGNPPWVFARGGNFSEAEKAYYYKKYPLANYQLNTYLLFVNLAHGLLNEDGHLGFIIPNTCLTIDSFQPFREFLLNEVGDLEIINIFGSVFEDASVDSCIVTFSRDKSDTVTLGELHDSQLDIVGTFKTSELAKDKHIINISMMKNLGIVKLIDKIDLCSSPLNAFSDIKAGLKAYETGKGTPAQTDEMKKERVYHATEKRDESYQKYLLGRDVQRYKIEWSGQWLSYGSNLAAPRKENFFVDPRILIRQIPSKPPLCINAVYTEERLLNDINSMIVLNFKKDPLFILSLLNSRLVSFWFINKFDKFQRGTFPQFKVKELAMFPIPDASAEQEKTLSQYATNVQSKYAEIAVINGRFETVLKSEFKDQEIHLKGSWWNGDFQEFVSSNKLNLTLQQKDELLALFDKYRAECTSLDQEIKDFEQKIDSIVYELFGLASDEINLVESV